MTDQSDPRVGDVWLDHKERRWIVVDTLSYAGAVDVLLKPVAHDAEQRWGCIFTMVHNGWQRREQGGAAMNLTTEELS